MFRFRCTIGANVVALATLACSEVTAPQAQQRPAFDQVVPAHHVVGSGHVQQPAGLREFTFHAVSHPAGSVSGSYRIVLPNGLFFEANVTCLAVAGHTGWVGGVIRATNAGGVIVGSTSMFYAIDGGEGSRTTDIVSLAAFNGVAGADLAFCADRPLALPRLTVTQGNVQVR